MLSILPTGSRESKVDSSLFVESKYFQFFIWTLHAFYKSSRKLAGNFRRNMCFEFGGAGLSHRKAALVSLTCRFTSIFRTARQTKLFLFPNVFWTKKFLAFTADTAKCRQPKATMDDNSHCNLSESEITLKDTFSFFISVNPPLRGLSSVLHKVVFLEVRITSRPCNLPWMSGYKTGENWQIVSRLNSGSVPKQCSSRASSNWLSWHMDGSFKINSQKIEAASSEKKKRSTMNFSTPIFFLPLIYISNHAAIRTRVTVRTFLCVNEEGRKQMKK